jgi:hypothetical protein
MSFKSASVRVSATAFSHVPRVSQLAEGGGGGGGVAVGGGTVGGGVELEDVVMTSRGLLADSRLPNDTRGVPKPRRAMLQVPAFLIQDVTSMVYQFPAVTAPDMPSQLAHAGEFEYVMPVSDQELSVT